MPENILFYVVFVSQVILISYYFPRKMLKRMKYIVETYPPATYPKLYPVSLEAVKRGQRNFKNLNLLVFSIGVILAFWGIVSGYSPGGTRDKLLLTLYFFAQYSPLLIAEFTGYKYFKMMRKANSLATRKAELQPRRLFDFISPALFGIAVFLYAAFIFLVLYVNQFEFYWGSKAFLNILILTAGNLFFAAIIAWNLYGKKLNPYQAYKDRNRQIEFNVKSLIFISIAATLFLSIVIVFDKFNLDNFMPAAISLYFQLLAIISNTTMSRVFRVEDMDFEVYKEEPLAT